MTSAMRSFRNLCAAMALGAGLAMPALAEPIDGACTYQGELTMNGVPANGTFDIRVRAFDAWSGGNQVGTSLCFVAQQVVDGRFTVRLPEWVLAVDGQKRWLEISVAPTEGADCDNMTTLFPRQELTAAPHAEYANQTRGLFVNDAGTFASVGGRETPITLAESFGVHRTVSAGNYGGMYVSTNEGGKPFYGYAAGGTIRAFHYFEGPAATGAWKLNVNLVDRLKVEANGGTFVLPRIAGGTPLEISPDGDYVYFRQWEGTLGKVMMKFGEEFYDRTVSFPGRVGIGQDFAHVPLHVKAENDAVAIFDRHGSDGIVVAFSKGTNAQGTVSISGSTVSYNAFTGSHYAMFEPGVTLPAERGVLLTMTGDNRRMRGERVGETVHTVRLSSTANDPAIIGVYAGPLDGAKPVGDENPVLASAEGNGDLWLIDDGRGDVEPGDLLISSDLAGAAMLDDPARFAVGHIVARSAQRVRWAEVTPDADGRRRVLAAVLFDRFSRQTNADDLKARLDEQAREIEKLKSMIGELAGR